MVIKVECEKNLVCMVALIAGALFINAAVLIMLQILLSQHMNQLINVICITVSTCCGFVVFPAALFRRIYNTTFRSFGLSNPKPADYAIIMLSAIAVTVAFFCAKQQANYFLLLIAQNFVVAFSEEFICRGALIFSLNKVIKSNAIIAIIAIVIFVFIFHSGAPVVENLIWRLPLSILIVCIYLKRGSIYMPFAIHFAYNVIVSLI